MPLDSVPDSVGIDPDVMTRLRAASTAPQAAGAPSPVMAAPSNDTSASVGIDPEVMTRLRQAAVPPTISSHIPMTQPIGTTEYGAPIYGNDQENAQVQEGQNRLTEKVGEGMTGGLLPPIVAGVSAFLGNSNREPSADIYQRTLDAQRKYTEQTSQEHPAAAAIGEGVGMLAPTMLTFGAVNPLETAAVRAAPQLIRPLVRPAIQGAVGAGLGAGTALTKDVGMGTTDNALQDAIRGAEWGGAFGAAPAIAGPPVRSLLRYAGAKGFGSKSLVDGATDAQGMPVSATPEQQQAAVDKVYAAVGPENKAGFDAALNEPGSPVPGVQRTLAEQTQTPGISSLQKPYEIAGYGPQFSQRTQSNAQALSAHLDATAPSYDQPNPPNPSSFGQHFTSQLDDIQAQKAAVEPALAGDVKGQVDALGAPQPAEASGATMQTAVDAQQAGRQAVADQNVADAAAQRDQAMPAANRQPIPGGATVGEQYGAEVRGSAMVNRHDTSTREQELWQAINRDGSAGAVSSTFKDRMAGVYDAIPESAVQPKGEELNIIKTVANWPDVVPLTEVQAMHTRLNDAITAEVNAAGRTQTTISRRLTATKQALDQALRDTLNSTQVAEREAVAAGQMRPEDTIEARVQAVRAKWGIDAEPSATPATRLLTAEELAAYKTANSFSQQRARTFDEGPVGDILAPGDNRTAAQVPDNITRAKGGFAQPDAEVMGKLWNGKDTEATNLRAAQAAGISPEVLKQYATDDLRAFATDANGNFDPKKFVQWRRNHAAGLHVYPEVKDAFDGVVKAQATLVARQAEADAVAASNPLKGVTHPSEVPGQYIKSGDTGADMAKQFIKDSGGDATAMQAFDDSLVRKMHETPNLVEPNGSINAAELDKFRSKYAGALSQRNELSGKLSGVAEAQAEYNRVIGEFNAQAAAIKDGAAKNFLKDDVPTAIGKAFGSGNPVRTFRDLFGQVRGSPEATEGLRRGVADYIIDKFRSARPAGTDADFIKSGQFRAWVHNNREPLKVIFGGSGYNNIDQVAAELRRQAFNPEVSGSPTAQRILGAERAGLRDQGGHGNNMGPIALVELVAEGHGVPGLGLIYGAGRWLKNSMSQAGIKTQNDLVKSMLLNPQLTKQLAEASRAAPTPIALNRLAATFVRGAAISGAMTASQH